VADAGFAGLYVDCNAVSPGTAREIGAVVVAGGAEFVDGGIVGGPPVAPGDTRLYLAGEEAGEVAALFTGSALDARVISAEVGAASAVKMSYAAWTKGTAALLLAIRALAQAEGVEAALLAEWELSQPGLEARSSRAASSAAAKGWRWIAEMEEIAASMTAHDLPGGFHQAAAKIYRSLEAKPHAHFTTRQTAVDGLASGGSPRSFARATASATSSRKSAKFRRSFCHDGRSLRT
jgi:3-hydroxyisobutyrate dehydrogenase-like beta-hydroxyacid dehydrogenase